MKIKSMKRILKFIIVIGIILVTLLLIYSNKVHTGRSSAARQGRLDLSQWDFVKSGSVNLNGEWEFYDNQLLTPDDFNGKGNKLPKLTGYADLTSSVLKNKNTKLANPIGVKTYRLVVKIKPSNNTYGLKIGNIKMSNKVFVNGDIKGERGNPAEKNNGYVPSNIPYCTYFNINGDKAEIIIQTANFEYPFAGTMYKINFGLQDNINYANIISISIEMIGSVLTLLFGMYYLGVYFNRERDKRFLSTGLYFFTIPATLLFNGEKLVMQLFPGIPSELMSKVQQISFILTIVMLSEIMNQLDKEILSDKAAKKVKIYSIIYIFIVVIADYSKYVYLLPFMYTIVTAFIMYIIIKLLNTIVRKEFGSLHRSGTLILLKSLICLFIAIIINFMYNFRLLNSIIFGSIAFFGYILFMVNLQADILSEAYKNMKEMSTELIKMDKVKDEFITKTSSELKAPLFGIINIAETVIKENKNDLSSKHIKDMIITKDIALKLTNTINDTLDITLLRNGQLKINISIVDIKVCINIVIESFKYIIQHRNIEIINNVHGCLMVKADENRVIQILFNLISNSIKSMDKGTIKLNGERINNMVYVSVEDAGCGIPKSKYNEVFNAYESLNSEGIGMGLFICRQLIQLMNGSIYLKWSEINKGSCFVFSLPYSEEKYDESIIADNENIKYFQPEASIQNKDNNYESTILIVDDELLNIQTALDILSRENYNVLTAFSGEEALEKINNNKIDLVVLDALMPRISGIDVCRKIRQRYSLIELPILISVLGNINYSLSLGFDAGANDFIAKPFVEKELILRTRTLITMRKYMDNALKSEMAFLQAQIKPHFLYNTLSTIISFCYTDGEKAAKLLTDFSKYLRLTFDIDNNTALSPLRRELEMIDAYVEIEKARFGDKIKIEYFIQQEILDKKIPSLCIQPLVENAIKHGLLKKEQGGTVYISAKEKDNFINITVSDTGAGMAKEKIERLRKADNNGVGLSNVFKRIKGLGNSSIDIYSTLGKGTKIILHIDKSRC